MNRNDFFTIIAIIIALTGGIPGIIHLIRGKVILIIHCYKMSYGFYEDKVNHIPQSVLLIIPLTIYNSGERALPVVSIDANVLINDKKYPLTKLIIGVPTSIQGTPYTSSRGEIINELKPQLDLQLTKFIVTKESSKEGFLAFVSSDLQHTDLMNKLFWIEFAVYDNTGKKRTYKHIFNVDVNNVSV